MNAPHETPLLRRFVVLGILLLLMLGVEALGAPSAGQKALVLAAIGFVILTSFSVAETGSALSLPRVTGYILTGAVLTQSGILSVEVANELRMFNTLALGLIALGAGLELSLPALRRLSRTLLVTSLSKVLLAAPLVGLATYGYITWGGAIGLPLPPLPAENGAVAFAIVLGALSIGTSPSIALAVISESKSKGRVSDLVLGAAVLKDIVVVVALAIAIAVVTGLTSGGPLDPSALSYVAKEIGYSILAGLLLGVLLIAYIRYVRAEMLLFVGAMILSVAEFARLLHLELLLVFIAGGFVVRNFSRYEHELSRPVQLVSLPIFVVFFTIAGAHINLRTTALFLPLALFLAVTRAIGFRASAAIGNAAGGEDVAVRKNVWLGYLPQAGVTLGLLGLVSQELPNLASALQSGGMAFIAINLLVGPITLRLALKRAGESPAGDHDEEPSDSSLGSSTDLPTELASPVATVSERLETELLVEIQDEQGRLADQAAEAALSLLRAFHGADGDPAKIWSAERARLESLDWDEAKELYPRARAILRAIPESVRVPVLLSDLEPGPDDSSPVLQRKRLRRLALRATFREKSHREVPLRRLTRECFEPRLAELSAHLWARRFRLWGALLEDLAACETLRLPLEECEQRLRSRATEWQEDAKADIRSLVGRAEAELMPLAKAYGTPYLPAARHRQRDVDAEARASLGAFGTAKEWVLALDADYNRLIAHRLLGRLELEVQTHVYQRLSGAMVASTKSLRQNLDVWHDEMKSVGLDPELESRRRRCEAHRTLLTEQPRALVERTTAEVRQVLDLRPLSHWLEERISGLPETMLIVSQALLPSRAAHPKELSFRTQDLRKLAETWLLKNATTRLETNAQEFEAAFRGLCADLLRAQDDFRATPLALATEAEPARDESAPAVEALSDAYHQCKTDLALHLERLQTTESVTMKEAVTSLKASVLLRGTTSGSQSQTAYLVAQLRLIWGRLERRASLATLSAKSWWRHTGERAFGGLREEITARSGTQAVDAQSLSQVLRALEPETGREYTSHFSLTPIRDPARFVAHRALLNDLVALEARWLRGNVGSALIVGEHGSGKTSLLNMLQYRVTAPRVIRLEPLGRRRDVGVSRALAYSLGCKPSPSALRVALTRTATHVLIDDLEQWLRPGEPGVADATELLSLVCATRQKAFWSVTSNGDFFTRLSEVVDLHTSFGKVAQILPLSRVELREVLEARQTASGRALELPRTLSAWFRFKNLRSGDTELVYEGIRRSSQGNISRALILWTLLAKVQDDETVRLRASRAPLAISLPFLKALGGTELALLGLLSRLGPLTFSELQAELRVDPAHLERLLHFLQSGGLLQGSEPSGQIALAPHFSALTALGLKGLSAA